MSRYYNMSVTVTGARPDRFDEIRASASAEWAFDDWQEHDGVLTASADDRLCGGETEPEFAERLAKTVWAANGGPCGVDVTATYLEELPSESYSLDESDYDRLITANEEATDDG
jgi:hypothetical protein